MNRRGSVRRVLTRILRIGWEGRFALLQATLLLLFTRMALIILPFRSVLKLSDRIEPRAREPGEQRDLSTMVWAVTAVGDRLFPNSPCLTQAVIIHRLFLRNGQSAELRIGVRKDQKGKFEAHAWVESEGEVVIGGNALSKGFVPLPPVTPLRGQSSRTGGDSL